MLRVDSIGFVRLLVRDRWSTSSRMIVPRRALVEVCPGILRGVGRILRLERAVPSGHILCILHSDAKLDATRLMTMIWMLMTMMIMMYRDKRAELQLSLGKKIFIYQRKSAVQFD